MMFNSNPTAVFAENCGSDAKNVKFSSADEFALEKQRIAELMYEAVVSGDNELAAQYRTEI